MPNITTFDILDNEIKKVGSNPTVLEALWDGDTQGWFLCLYLYTETGFFFNKKLNRHSLGHISLGGDIRVFSGGQWTEAFLANEFGEAAVKKYNLEFYFPSKDEPDNDCPKWTERHLAIHCEDCNKLIIPTDSPYLPKDICYNCHLKREQNERIKNAIPCDDGVTMYLSKNDEFENIGYCTYFKDFTIAPFVNEKVQKQLGEKGINIITLDKQDAIELKSNLETVLNEKLTRYEKPIIDEQMKRFASTYMVEYKDEQYELIDRFNSDHTEISNLISSFKTVEKAINEGYSYKIFFKKGITYRDDTILRFINYVCKGVASQLSIIERYKNVLTKNEVLVTLKKLDEIGCVTSNKEDVSITAIGKCIV